MTDAVARRTGNRSLGWLALTVALLPVATIITTYFISASAGYVGWCCPVLDGCTSISATGRHGLSYFIFKGAMIPAGMLLLFKRVRELILSGQLQLGQWVQRTMFVLLALMLLIGLASIPLANFMANRNRPQNMAAWTLALLVQIYYLLVWLAWRRTGFRAFFLASPERDRSGP